MAKKKQVVVRWQDGSTDPSKDNYTELSGDAQAYETDVAKHRGEEAASANPDVISDEALGDLPEGAHPSGEKILMNEAVALLSPQQRKVWELCMQHGSTQEDAAAILGISRDTVKTFLHRAIKHVTVYCQANMHRLNKDA